MTRLRRTRARSSSYQTLVLVLSVTHRDLLLFACKRSPASTHSAHFMGDRILYCLRSEDNGTSDFGVHDIFECTLIRMQSCSKNNGKKGRVHVGGGHKAFSISIILPPLLSLIYFEVRMPNKRLARSFALHTRAFAPSPHMYGVRLY